MCISVSQTAGCKGGWRLCGEGHRAGLNVFGTGDCQGLKKKMEQ